MGMNAPHFKRQFRALNRLPVLMLNKAARRNHERRDKSRPFHALHNYDTPRGKFLEVLLRAASIRKTSIVVRGRSTAPVRWETLALVITRTNNNERQYEKRQQERIPWHSRRLVRPRGYSRPAAARQGRCFNRS